MMINNIKPQNGISFTTFQSFLFTLLRIAIGWHFLYEGISKLFSPNWSAAGYLDISRWVFSGLFHWMASNPSILAVVNFLNIWGLILIGLALILGAFTRLAGIAGFILLLIYYIANPPFNSLGFQLPHEGNYLFVDKNLIEMIALAALALIPSSQFYGLERLISLIASKKSPKTSQKPMTVATEKAEHVSVSADRRTVLKSLATIPFLGAFTFAVLNRHGLKSNEEKNLVDAVTSATIKSFNFTSLKELKDKVPHTQIKGVDFSRLILGGNLIGGWAHARDLIYASKLVKAYHSDEKIFETFYLAEKCGINAILTNPLLCGVINKYWNRQIGTIKFISDCGGTDLLEMVKKSIDNGASSCYVQGGIADDLVKKGNFDLIAKALDLIRQNKLPAGIGGHYLETIQACVTQGLEPDYWMKTLHHTDYWSAHQQEECDNIFDRRPRDTIAYMKNLKQPWIAFKILAAGAIEPQVGMRYALENGADMLCVGMYDFQIVDDVNIFLDIYKSNLKRERAWVV